MKTTKDESKKTKVPAKISPIRWPGGKRILAKRIIDMFPKHNLYAEAFAGALHVFFKKERSQVEAVNDINGNLITFYKVVQEKPYQLLLELMWDLPSRQLFLEYKAQLESRTDLTDIQRAKLFFYVLKMSFSGTMRQYGYSRSGNPPINLVDIEQIILNAHDRLKKVNIENIDWKRFVLKYDTEGTLHYLDPPYYCDTSKRVYQQSLNQDDFREMNSVLAEIKGKFILSLNDCNFIRKTFKAFKVEVVETSYSMRNGKNWKVKELIIRNF